MFASQTNYESIQTGMLKNQRDRKTVIVSGMYNNFQAHQYTLIDQIIPQTLTTK